MPTTVEEYFLSMMAVTDSTISTVIMSHLPQIEV